MPCDIKSPSKQQLQYNTKVQYNNSTIKIFILLLRSTIEYFSQNLLVSSFSADVNCISLLVAFDQVTVLGLNRCRHNSGQRTLKIP